jgi:multiple sugar transport system substrate-binding protein
LVKRILALISAGTLFLSLMSGCTKTSSDSASSGKIPAKPKSISLICTSDDVTMFQTVAKTYKEKYGIDVTIISQSYDNTHQKIITSFMGGSKVDLTYVDTVWPAEFAAAKILSPLDEYLTSDVRKSFIDASLEQLGYNGKTYAVPYANNGKWLFYNKKLLTEEGYTAPPKTWDELFAMSKKLIADKKIKNGITWAGKQAEGLVCDFTSLLYGYGGQWMDSKGNMIFNSGSGVKALTMVVNSMKDGTADPASITYDDRTDLDPFLAGDTAFVMDWSFAWALVNDPQSSKVAGDVAIGLIPGDSSANVTSASVTGGGGIGILSSSQNKYWAWKFIELMTGVDTQKAAFESSTILPTVKSVYQDSDLLTKYPYLKDMYNQYQYMHFRPALPGYSKWSQGVQNDLEMAMIGKSTPQQALDDAAKISGSES